ncbi:MAG: hypothetical protein KAV87_64990 [Desulfobacteraceae bacterium]|nr:hypothetical protein [Desulfobacteraceae bacterium]
MSRIAIYGKGTYGVAKYGDVTGQAGTPNNFYNGRPVGNKIRGQIGKEVIYRVRKGNGYVGSTVGRTYQDRYRYFVPTTIMHPNGNASRATFALAIAAWKNLSAEEKQKYSATATRRGGLTGYNLFVSNYMKENY